MITEGEAEPGRCCFVPVSILCLSLIAKSIGMPTRGVSVRSFPSTDVAVQNISIYAELLATRTLRPAPSQHEAEACPPLSLGMLGPEEPPLCSAHCPLCLE